MSPDLRSLAMSLASTDVVTRRETAESLAKAGPDAVTVAIPLVQACGDDDEEVRNWVVAALEELPPPNASDAAALEAFINGENLDVSFWATTLLGRMEAAAAPTVPTLASAVIDHPELVVRERAAWALGKIGKPAAGAIPQLEAAATSEEPRLARFATIALQAVRS
jgi:HEAT repeat protein